MILVLFLLGLLVLPAAAFSQTAGVEPVHLRTIMADPDWIGRAPESPYWSDDSATVYYERKREGSEIRDLWRVPSAEGEAEKVPDEQLAAADVPNGDWNRARTSKVFERGGDLYLHDLSSGARLQLTRTAERESDPQLLVDGRVAFRRGDTFVVLHLDTGLIEEPFVLRLEQDPDEKRQKEREERSYLPRQQERLLEIVRERERRREQMHQRERERQAADLATVDLPWYLGDEVEIQSMALSPTGRHLLLTLVPSQRESGRAAEMPVWITDSAYIESREVRSKVGTGEPYATRLLLLDRESREVIEVDLTTLPGVTEDPLADLRAAAEARREAEEEAAKDDDAPDAAGVATTETAAEDDEKKEEPKPRPLRVTDLRWNEEGTLASFQGYSFDNKDRWIAVVEPGSEEPLAVRRIHDPAWINWRYRDVTWLPDGESLVYLSEESGYSQVYRVRFDGSHHRQLTDGAFVVDDPWLCPEGRHLFVRANVGDPGTYEIWRLDVETGDFVQLSELGGLNAAVVSPDEQRLLILHSRAARPPELWVQEARPGATARQLTQTTSEAFLAHDWREPLYVEVPSSHVERPIHARLYLPDSPAPPEGRPAVLFVHGAGYLQNAHRGWSSYFREFMFHTLLTRRGYVVLDMDYRASAGYGRDWRTAIYRQMGTPEVEDLADGVDWLVESHEVDRDRVGVYGGSYGGFLTFMAMFKEPELFAAGAALRPVTDWAHYNHGYTSNILNTPEVDPEAYERSSPIELAEGLSKPLLICAPMLDDNVFFLDSVRLVQRLIELEKEDWEIAIYPVEPHSFREPSSWLDEYRRILELFERTLRPGADG